LNRIIRFSYEVLNFSPVSPFLLSSVCYPFQTDTFLSQSPLLAPSMNPAFWVEGREWFCCHYFPTKATTLIIQIVMRKLAPLFQFVPYPSHRLLHLVVLCLLSCVTSYITPFLSCSASSAFKSSSFTLRNKEQDIYLDLTFSWEEKYGAGWQEVVAQWVLAHFGGEGTWWMHCKNFPALYGTRRFSTVFIRALHWSLSWARSSNAHDLILSLYDPLQYCQPA
jgi:hypothetical protein